MENDTNSTPQTTRCLNCGTEFQGKFCPECGQSADTGPYTPRFLVDNLITAVLGQDGSIWFTIKNLFTRPGEMIIDTLNGKRKKYISPFPMLFMVLALYILIVGLFNASLADMLIEEPPELVGATSDEIASYKANHIDIADIFLKFYYSHYTLCTVLTLPLAVIAARACYGKNNRKRYNWAEYTIVVVYSTVILMLFRCLTKLLFPIGPETTTAIGIALSPLVAIIAYTVCFRKMLGFSVVKAAWRSVLMELLYYLLMGLLIVVIILVFAIIVVFKY